MNTPDSRLSAAERAALADLEAAAAAADPSLAARLRGGVAWRLVPVLRIMHSRSLRVRAAVLRAGWWGVPVALVGVVLMLLGLSAGLGLALVGAVATVVGLRILADKVEQAISARRARAERDSTA